MPKAGVIIIGDEILSGKFTDENTPFLAKRLRELGVDLRRVSVIPDDIEQIGAEVKAFHERFDHVFTTGGVGPTHDDVTMEGVARGFGVALERHPALEQVLRDKLGEACNDAALRMAEVPVGASLWWDGPMVWPVVAMQNVAIFPGVPSLLRRKFDAVAGRFQGVPVQGRRLVTLAQETAIAHILRAAQDRWPAVSIGSYPQLDVDPHTVTITLDSRDPAALERCEAWLRDELAGGLCG